MNIIESVTESIKSINPDVALDAPEQYEQKLKDLGVDSIQFLGMVMTVCEKLNVDISQINSMEISTENTITEFAANFKAYVPGEVTA